MHPYAVVMPPDSVDSASDHQGTCGEYPRGMHSFLMLMQLVVGAICLGLVADMGSYRAQAVLSGKEFTVNAYISFGETTALMMVGYGCLMTTFVLLLSSLVSFRTFYHVPKSLFFILYHSMSALLYLSSGLSVVVLAYQRRYEQSFVTAGAMGIVNAILYLCTACISYKTIRGMK